MARDALVIVDTRNHIDGIRAQTVLWANALGDLGFSVRQLDVARDDASDSTNARALDDCEVALVENVCAMQARGTDLTRAFDAFSTRGGRIVFHHHDLPWQPDWSGPRDVEPPHVDNAVHVGISMRAQRDLHARGYLPVVAIHDHYDFEASPGTRDTTRAAMGFGDDEIVIHQPTRASRTTNVAGAVRFLRALDGMIKNRPLRYWLRGPIDDDVASTVERLLEHCPAPVTIDDRVATPDAIAASDVALVPSTWDRSGAGAVQAVLGRRPCVVGPFPLLGELQAIGLRFFDLDEPVELVKFLARTAGTGDASDRLLDVNLRRASLSFAVTDLPPKVADVLTLAGVST